MTLFAAIIIVIGFLLLGIMHEQVHVQIYKHYGVDSHVEYFSHFPDLVTIPDKPCPTPDCVSDNNMNEIVGYPLVVFYWLFSILLLIIIGVEEILINLKLTEVKQ